MRARKLRQTATEPEKRLWSKLRGGRLDGLSFRRQHPAGPCILDFHCPELSLSIELDGGQHTYQIQEAHDAKRTLWLRRCGVTELRFWNTDVSKNLHGVLEQIKETADELKKAVRTPTRRWRAALPLSGGGQE